MLFASPLYGVFLFAAYFVFWSLRKQRLARAIFLVAASYIFYFYGTYDAAHDKAVPLGPIGWSALCLGIIFVGSSLDYQIGKALAKTDSPRSRKALLLCSIVYYLGVLSLFKYFNFAADSFTGALHLAGINLEAAIFAEFWIDSCRIPSGKDLQGHIGRLGAHQIE